MNDSTIRDRLFNTFEEKTRQRYIDRLPGTVRFWMDPRLSHRIDVDEVTEEIAQTLNRRRGMRGATSESLVTSMRSLTLDTLDRIQREYLGDNEFYIRRPILRLAGLPPASLKDLAGLLVSANGSQSADDSATMCLGIQRAFNSLSLHHREILAMRHFERLSPEEISEATQLSLQHVSCRYRRALARLREKIVRADTNP